jgi:hypothetical protein
VVATAFLDLPRVKEEDLVGFAYGRKSVGDDQDQAVPTRFAKGGHEIPLRVWI